MSKLTKKEIGAHIALVVAAMLWGTTFVAISSTKGYFPSAYLVFLRCAIGGIVLLLVFYKRLKDLSRSYLFACALLGFLMAFGYFLQNVAINTGCPPGRCAFLASTYCAVTPFIAWFVWKRKPNVYHIIGALLCLIGISFIFLPELLKDSNVGLNIGDFFALVGSLVFGIYLVYLGRYVDVLDPILLTTGNLFFGALYSWLYSCFAESDATIIWSLQSAFAAVYLGAVCMSLTNILQAIGQREVVASTTALIFSLEAVFGVIIAIAFWGETVTVHFLLGCFFIFIAIVVSETKLGFLRKKLSRSVFKKFFSYKEESGRS